jgi:hypothetical protein
MPSILKTKARRVIRYFNKHGFSDMKLTIYIMDEKSTLEQVVELEQHFLDTFFLFLVIKKKTIKPNLNVDLVASSSVKVIYSNSDKELTIKENRGKSGVYR